MTSNLDDHEFGEFLNFMREEIRAIITQDAIESMDKALTHLHSSIPPYPPLSPSQRIVSPDGASFLKTDKQRRWFFANLREGGIKGWRIGADGRPEKFATNRSGNLGRKFTTAVTAKDGIIEGEVGTNVPYAPWVVGSDYPGEEIGSRNMYQAKVHVDRWWQFIPEMQKEVETAYNIFAEEFYKRFQENWK